MSLCPPSGFAPASAHLLAGLSKLDEAQFGGRLPMVPLYNLGGAVPDAPPEHLHLLQIRACKCTPHRTRHFWRVPTQSVALCCFPARQPSFTRVKRFLRPQIRTCGSSPFKVTQNTRLRVPVRLHITCTTWGQDIEGLSEGRKFDENPSEIPSQFKPLLATFQARFAFRRYGPLR